MQKIQTVFRTHRSKQILSACPISMIPHHTWPTLPTLILLWLVAVKRLELASCTCFHKFVVATSNSAQRDIMVVARKNTKVNRTTNPTSSIPFVYRMTCSKRSWYMFSIGHNGKKRRRANRFVFGFDWLIKNQISKYKKAEHVSR